jgi:hypothetical protein
MTTKTCENCAHFEKKKQWCEKLGVPVIEELFCSHFEGGV